MKTLRYLLNLHLYARPDRANRLYMHCRCIPEVLSSMAAVWDLLNFISVVIVKYREYKNVEFDLVSWASFGFGSCIVVLDCVSLTFEFDFIW